MILDCGTRESGIGHYIELSFADSFDPPNDPDDGEQPGVLKYWHLQGNPCDGLGLHPGDEVNIGAVIGYVGGSGAATSAPHLHLGYYPNWNYAGIEHEREYSYNPVALFNYDINSSWDDFEVSNVRVEQQDEVYWFTFDVLVNPRRLDLNRIEVRFQAVDVEGFFRSHDRDLIDSQTGFPRRPEEDDPYYDPNNGYYRPPVYQEIDIIDFEGRIGYDSGPRVTNAWLGMQHENFSTYNGVRIEPAALNNSRWSGYQTNRHRYTIRFRLRNEILRNLLGGIQYIYIDIYSIFRPQIPIDVNIQWFDFDLPVTWVEEWPYNLDSLSTTARFITVENGGVILIKNAGSTEQDHVKFRGTLTLRNGGTLWLENGPDFNHRTFFTNQGHIIFENGSRLHFGDYAWYINEGTTEFQPGSEVTYTDARGEYIERGITIGNTDLNIVNFASCLLLQGGTFRLGAGRTLSFSDGAFFASQQGTLVLEDNARLVYRASARPLVIQADQGPTIFKLGKNAQIIFERPVEVVGTATHPVRFERLEPSQPWKELTLRADSNRFEYVVFDGGTKTVEIFSRGNVFRFCRFRNGWRGLSSHFYQYPANQGRSSFRLEQSIIENNQTIGVVAYHADVTLQQVTVRGNGQAGLWLYDGYGTISRSVIENNGVTASSRSGIEVHYNAYLLFPGYEAGGPQSYNRIARNAHHEVYLAAGADGAWLGYCTLFGHPPFYEEFHDGDYNAIFDDGPQASGEKLVYNASGTNVLARCNYWAGAGASKFYGPIDRAYALGYDPTGSSGANEGGVPARVASNAPPVVPTNGLGASVAAAPGVSVSVAIAEEDEALRAQMRTLRARLLSAPEAPEAARWLRELYALEQADRWDRLGERTANRQVRALLAKRLLAGAHLSAAGRRAGEVALLLELRALLAAGRYAEAAARLKFYDRWIREAAHRRELRWARLVLLEQAGRLAEARAALTALEAAASGTERATWSVLTEALGTQAAAEVAAAKRPEEAPQGMAAAKEAETKPEALALAVYPHPLRNRGMLMLGLPEAAKVRVVVYDVLGREVGVLLSGLQSAGWHRVVLDGRRWRSGWYVVRAEIVWMDGRVEVRTQPLLRMP
ncbi:right-handed parallel beta-helix repeat-containing protein [Rhodothermus profundi]|uniref:Right handed beta helix domain-containing protein n=1 Tax=Rhodothermus profundi TaxID=633813 RepID=A0A1M6UUH8_9BACT|nr:right-handed parallel beta-helix repeat-containing protein [Rhodothermus profundi]SHK72706.1 hypothetical protein SAMN04488087_1864 [Rhodothermus profundi]